MPKLIVINSSNYVQGSGNRFVYTLPSSVKLTTKSKVGVAAISVYNSTFNISAARGNNTLAFDFHAASTITKTYTIPDGYYSVSDLNYFLQSKMFADNLYVFSNNGANVVYFFEIVLNSVQYSTQLNSYYLPQTGEAVTLGYTKPSGASWAFPVANRAPQLTFNAAFGSLIGFNAQQFPASVFSTNQSKISEKSPNISPIDSYNLTCNLINSRYSIPNNVFFSLPLTGSLGQLITFNSSNLVMNDIAPNVYSNIVIQFFDQLFNKFDMRDVEIVISIVIDDSGETD